MRHREQAEGPNRPSPSQPTRIGAQVSVVIPAYNRARTVARAIESVMAQTVGDLEIIVVDDGSKDSTSQVVAGLLALTPKLTLLRHETNKGAQAARNTGAQVARGEWLCFLDSDDQFLPNSIEVRLREAERGGFPVIHSSGWKIEAGEKRQYGLTPMIGNVYADLLRRPGPMYQSLLIRADAFRAIGGLDPAIVAFQEWDTSIRLAKDYRFGYVREPTFVYDCTGTDTISKNLTRAARGYDQVVQKHFSEIKRLGRRVVSYHYRQAAAEYRAAGDFATARKRLGQSLLWWPGPRTVAAFAFSRQSVRA